MDAQARRRTTGRGLGVAVAALALAGIANGTSASAADPLTMVALGDSSAAGPLVGSQSSWDCLRSSSNWPARAAQLVGAQLTDVTCSGATTADLTGPRYGYIAPQLDAITADTDIVTLAIGANDINLGGTVASCMQPFPAPFGVSCKSWLTAGGDPTGGQLAQVAPRVADALQRIHAKAPDAQVYVVGYLSYWATGGGCWFRDPIWDVDARWLQTVFDRVNSMLRDTAAANGATYVDLATPSVGHGVCADDADRWVEGLFPTSAAAPYHPNQKGMDAAGGIVAQAIS